MKIDFSANKIMMEKVNIPLQKDIKSSKSSFWLTNQKDDYYEQILKLYNESSLHHAILNNLIDKVVGTNIGASRAIKRLVYNAVQDLATLGGYCVEVIWNIEHTKINKLLYLPLSQVRSGFVNEDTDEVLLYYYSPDWKDKNSEITVLRRFDPDPTTDNHQIYFFNDGRGIYPIPYYAPSMRWVVTDVELTRYYSNLAKNNFMPTVMMVLRNGFEDDDKRIAFERTMLGTLTGPDNAGAIPIIYGDGSDSDPIKIVPVATGTDDVKYQWLSQQTIDQLIMAHRIPNPMLAGVRVPGTLGGTQELKESEFIYNRNIVYPLRDKLMEFLEDVQPFYINPIDINIKDISVIGEQEITNNI